MILHGTVVHRWLCEAISWAFAWNCVHKLPHKAISWLFAWRCRAQAALQNYFWSFCMELPCKSCLTKLFLKLLPGTVMQKLPFEAIPQALVGKCRAKAAFWNYLLTFRMEVNGTAVQTLPCVKYCSVLPGSCNVLLNNGRGLGRRLSSVGRDQIRLFMVHDTAWTCRA